MALQHPIEVEIYGQIIKFENAYHRIELLERNGNDITINLASYNDSSIQHRIKTSFYNYTLENGEENSIKRGYDHIKSLDKFVNAVDV